MFRNLRVVPEPMRRSSCVLAAAAAAASSAFSTTKAFFSGVVRPRRMGALFSSSGPTLSSQRVWVTGASSGLGEAMAYEYAKQKASLVLSARRVDKLEEVAATCQELGAPQCAVVALDQERLDSERIDEALASFGGVDVAVINGGVSSRGTALETDLPTLRRVTEINFLASAEIGRRVAADMKRRGVPGRLVVVSSVQAFFGLPSRSAYASSKHALRGYFDALRAEVASDGISVTVAAPGYVKTELSRNALKSDGSAYGATDTSTERGADPAFVARAILAAADNRRAETLVVPGLSATVALFLRALAPSLLFRLMRNRADTELRLSRRKDDLDDDDGNAAARKDQ